MTDIARCMGRVDDDAILHTQCRMCIRYFSQKLIGNDPVWWIEPHLSDGDCPQFKKMSEEV